MVIYTPPKPADRLPLIELPPAGSDEAGRRAVAGEIHKACRDTGFFYVAGHGVPAQLTRAQLEWTSRLFAMPPAAKQVVHWGLSNCRRGYEGLAAQALDPDSPPDLKESFYVGRELPSDHPYVKTGVPNQGANLWPQGLDGFRCQTEVYFNALLGLSNRLMGLIALSLDLREDHFVAMHGEPMPILRLIHYPSQPSDAAPNQLGAGAHTDWGSVTLLLQDEVGGLEVENAAGDWLKAEPVPGTFVVNLGDMVARWTNGLYHSNRHRVLNTSGRERYSAAFFANPDPMARIECLPTCTDADHPPKFAVCTAGEHLEEMYRLSYREKPVVSAVTAPQS